MIERLKAMPATVIVMGFTFMMIPIAATGFIPWHTLSAAGIGYGGMLALVFFLGPLGICLSLLYRNRLLLPWYALQCSALAGLVLFETYGTPPLQSFAYLTGMLVMASLGFLLMSEEILFPYDTGDPQAWRKAPRVLTDKMMRIVSADGELSCHVIAADASLTGLGLYGVEERLQEVLKDAKPGDYCQIVIGLGARERILESRIKWFRRDNGAMLIGVEAIDQREMQQLLRGLSQIAISHKLFYWLFRKWADWRFRLITVMSWFLLVGFSYGVTLAGLAETGKPSRDRIAQESLRADPSSRPDIAGY